MKFNGILHKGDVVYLRGYFHPYEVQYDEIYSLYGCNRDDVRSYRLNCIGDLKIFFPYFTQLNFYATISELAEKIIEINGEKHEPYTIEINHLDNACNCAKCSQVKYWNKVRQTKKM